MSLAARIAILVFAVEVAILLAIGGIARRVANEELRESFDASLRANAEALATLVEIEEDGKLELEFADEVMTRFSREKSPDQFAIMKATGEVLELSHSISEVPGWIHAKPSKKPDYHNFNERGEHYRGVVLSLVADLGSDEHHVPPVDIRIFFATSREGLDASQARVTGALFGALGAGVCVAALMALLVARSGLRPLRGFARAIDDVSPDRLGNKVDARKYPTELRRPAEAFNRLLLRVEHAMVREKSFSADAAHELRTPVASLKSEIQAARRSPRNADEDAAVFADMEAEVLRLEQLCEQLLVLAAPNATPIGRMTASELCAEVRSEIDLLAPMASERRVAVSMQEGVADPESALACDPTLLRRIVRNLLRNAIEHGGEGTSATVRVATSASGCELVVEDTGAGIPAKDRDQLFERFYRGDASRSRARGGAGLGLAICRDLAVRMGGTIALVPTETGAKFRVTLPAPDPQ